MGINIQNVAAYIHGQAPAKLDGLWYAVEAKCKELGLSPGRRDNVAGGSDDSVGCNVRGVLTFVAGVEKITDDDKKAIAVGPGDEPKAGDPHTLLVEKHERRNLKLNQESERKRRLAAKEADHDALRKLYGTLQGRFASAGYKPKPPPTEVVVTPPPVPAPATPTATPAKPAAPATTATPAKPPTPPKP